MAMSFTKGVDIAPTEQDVDNTKHHNLVDMAVTNNDGDRSNMSQTTSLVHIATSAPTTNTVPINGHLWYDSTNNILMEYDGTVWLPTARGTLFTNKSGGALSGGDLVVIDTGNAQSVTTTSTANSTDVIGVVLVGGADEATVVVITEGRCPAVTVTGATAIGDFLFSSTTVKEAVPSSTVSLGAFGRALTSTAGAGSVIVQLNVLGAGSDSTFSYSASDTFSGTQLHSSTTTQSITHSLGKLPRLITIGNYRSGSIFTGGFGVCAIDLFGNVDQSAVSASNTGGEGIALEDYSILNQATTGNYARGLINNVSTSGFDIVWTNVGTPGAITSNYLGMVYG